MSKGTRTIGTSGEPENREFDALWRRMRELEARLATLEVEPGVLVADENPANYSSVQIEVKESDGDPDLFTDGLEFDQADNFVVSESGNLAKIKQSANALLDANRHSDTVAQAVTKGSLVVGNATPKWDELVVGSNDQILTADSAQTLGVKWATPAPTTTTIPYWRVRGYQNGSVGSNQIIDGTYFFMPEVAGAGLNQPAGVLEKYFKWPGLPDGGFYIGYHQHLWVVWARMQISVTGTPNMNVYIPNADDNFGIWIQRPTVPTQTGSTSIVNNAGVGDVTGTGTLFLTEFAVGDLLICDPPIGDCYYITAILTNTTMTVQKAAPTSPATYTTIRRGKKIYQVSNAVAQNPVDQDLTETLEAGVSVLHIFANNHILQGAIVAILNAFQNANIVWQDAGE